MRRTLLTLLASSVVGLFAASPASAAIVTPLVSGSGSIPAVGCVSPQHLPTGTLAGCSSINVGGQLDLQPVPQPNPAGHWEFVRWDQCPQVVGTACRIPNTGGIPIQYTVLAVFRDVKGPAVGQPGVTYSTVNDRSVTMTYATTDEPAKSYVCSVDGAAFTACGNGSQAFTLPEGGHNVRVRAIDLSGNLGDVSPQQTFRVLDTALASGPTEFSNVKTPTFAFSTVAGLRFECALDTTAFTECDPSAPPGQQGRKTLGALADGTHTFRVRARDAGDFDRVPVIYTWTVDTVAPVATLDATSGPGEGALQAVNRETFKFASSEPGTFECRLDAAAFAPCATDVALERLTAGAHRFEVRAVDRAGNVGAVAARNWSVAAADNDNDGFNALIDCNDNDAAIRPGAVEILDNGIDENCDGIVGTVLQNTKPDQIVVTLAFFAKATKKTTKLSTLQVKNVPLGSTVTVTCKGKACPKGLKGKGFTKKNAFGTVSLAAFIKKPFRTGDQITVTVSKPGAISAVKVLTARAAKKPTIATKCVPPGTTKPVSC